MSQQEMQSFWGSWCYLCNEAIPLIIVSFLASIVSFFQRHFNVEPFSFSVFLTGLFCDVVFGTITGLAAIGAGFPRFIAWFVAGMSVNVGLRRIEKYATQWFEQKYKVGEYAGKKEDTNNDTNANG